VQIACAIGEAIEALAAGLQKISAQLEEETYTASGQQSLKPALEPELRLSD
jgi:hypothetical protein